MMFTLKLLSTFVIAGVLLWGCSCSDIGSDNTTTNPTGFNSKRIVAAKSDVSFAPDFLRLGCNDTDTTWIFLGEKMTGVEAAQFVVGYDPTCICPLSVCVPSDLEGNTFTYLHYPSSGCFAIDVGVLAGDFCGPGDFVGIVLEAGGVGVPTRLQFLHSDLRDCKNNSIVHTTSTGARITIDCNSD